MVRSGSAGGCVPDRAPGPGGGAAQQAQGPCSTTKREHMAMLVTVASFEVLGLTRGGEPLLVEKPDTIT